MEVQNDVTILNVMQEQFHLCLDEYQLLTDQEFEGTCTNVLSILLEYMGDSMSLFEKIRNGADYDQLLTQIPKSFLTYCSGLLEIIMECHLEDLQIRQSRRPSEDNVRRSSQTTFRESIAQRAGIGRRSTSNTSVSYARRSLARRQRNQTGGGRAAGSRHR